MYYYLDYIIESYALRTEPSAIGNPCRHIGVL